MEEWKDINGFNNYQISNTGKIRNSKRNKELSVCVGTNGYSVVNLCNNGKSYTHNIHRLVAESFLNPPTEEQITWANSTKKGKVQVNHIDGNKTNNNVENLEWCTGQENSKHAYNTGLSQPKPPETHGSTNGQSKLTETDVLEIRKLYSQNNYSQTDLAIKYNLNSSTISNIVNRKRWKHI